MPSGFGFMLSPTISAISCGLGSKMTLATTLAWHALVSKIKATIRDSALLATIIRQWPVENLPSWVGKKYGLRVPNGVVPFKVPLPIGNANIKIILGMAKSRLHLEGDLAECGVYRGETLIPLGLYIKQNHINKKIFGFDTFEGFGELAHSDPAENANIRTHCLFTDTSYEMVQGKITRLNLSERVFIIKGFFSNSLSGVRDRRFCFVHLDCDLYDSYKTCLNFFYNRMTSGGVILLDEYNDPPWPGCNRAVDEFLLDKPERLKEISSDNYVRYFIEKC